MATTTTKRCECLRCQGHDDPSKRGPFTPSEFLAMANVVEREPVQVDPALVELGAKVDEAVALYDGAKDAWLSATAEHGRLSRRPDADATARTDAEDLVKVARDRMDRIGLHLQRARAAYNEAAKEASLRRTEAEYAEGQRIMAERRAAARQTREDKLDKGFLGRIKKVAGK